MDYYRAKWWDVEGQFHTNFFVNIYDTRFSSYDVSYVTKCTDQEAALRSFLSHIPLNKVEVCKMTG